jgi:hypothetical protein
VVGDYYVKKVANKLRTLFPNDKELEFKFKIVRALILKALGSDLYKETLAQINKMKESSFIGDRSYVEDLEDKLKLF